MFKTSARRSRRDAQGKDDRKRPRFGAGMAVRHGVLFGKPPGMAYCSESRLAWRIVRKYRLALEYNLKNKNLEE